MVIVNPLPALLRCTARPARVCVAGTLGLVLLLLGPLGWGQSPLPSEPPRPDVDRGRQLYENHCLECHTSRVHVRERRKGHDPQAVRRQIYRWRAYLELPWEAEEVEDVYAYLDQRYYRFQASER